MARNVEAIRTWVRLNRPDMIESMDRVIDKGDNAHILLMATAFEAGRMFQATEVTDPTSYVPMEEIY